jgi:hypothetical protein
VKLTGDVPMTLKTWGMIGSVVILLSAAACAGHSAEGSASGGAMNAAGSGGAQAAVGGAGATGTGGNAHALPAQASITAYVGQPMVHVDQMACPVIEAYQVGAPDAPSAADPGESVVSGNAGSTISCSVMGQGMFGFSGSIRALTGTGDLISVTFANGTVGPDFAGTADISLYAPQLSSTFSSAAPCAIAVLNQQVKPGSLWATFSCPRIASPPSGLCGLSGVVVFENCSES